MRIPQSWLDKHGNATPYSTRLQRVDEQRATIGTQALTILCEPPRDGFTHGCSPRDVIRLLTLVADHVTSLPETLAFRQPTRKQQLLNPVWGRFLPFADFGNHQGPAIVLEAVEIGSPLLWSRRMSLEDRAEFDRYVASGFAFEESRGGCRARISAANIRDTILYRTLLHALGHWVDYHQKVLSKPTARDPDPDAARDLYLFATCLGTRSLCPFLCRQACRSSQVRWGYSVRPHGMTAGKAQPWHQVRAPTR